MPTIQETIELLHGPRTRKLFSLLYGREDTTISEQSKRYEHLVEKYGECFGDEDTHLFSSPGRTEIGGNHTDHNGGRVLAASVHLDSIAAAARSDDGQVVVYSEGYPAPFQIALNDLEAKKEEEGTTAALIRGTAARLKELGYSTGGIHAYITSRVMIGSGLSSSASIEILIGTIFNTLYNAGRIPKETLATIGRYAENVYFNKPCGLMDQLTCAVGGVVLIDFEDSQRPRVRRIDFDLSAHDYNLLVVYAGGDHADLRDEYASIPREMRSVAQALGGTVLRDIDSQVFAAQVRQFRSRVTDRALLRAYHFFEENERVLRQVDALEKGDFDSFLRFVNESGDSSCKWLQNCYRTADPSHQGIPLALALTENYLSKRGKGACRVHGGGFAGTIQAFIPTHLLDNYVRLIEDAFGDHSVVRLNIRPRGAVHMNSFLGDSEGQTG